MGNWTGSFRLGKASWEWWFGWAPHLPPLWSEELQVPPRLGSSLGKGAVVSALALVRAWTWKMLLAPQDRSSSRKRTGLNRWKQITRKPSPTKVIHYYRELVERRGGGDQPWGQLQRRLRFLPLPSGASLPGRSESGPTPWLHCPNEGGLGIWRIGCLTALMGSVVKEPFPSNAFLKNRRLLIVPIPVKGIPELFLHLSTPVLGKSPQGFISFSFFFLMFCKS